jgi:crotonobetainyl-CoA:carnitine CoA-transferase CaiB-like acyl-CoA transferase
VAEASGRAKSKTFSPALRLVISALAAALKRDVADTVGDVHAALVDGAVAAGREYISDEDRLAQHVVDEVQQYFHDMFVDTTWPACPRHPNHPLWFENGWWRCTRDDVAIVRLGELGTISKPGVR